MDVDVPEVARAVTDLVRGHAVVGVIQVDGARYVQIRGDAAACLVLKADWEKILPLLENETFNVQRFPVQAGGRSLDTVGRLSSDARDPLYLRVYGALGQLFSTKVST